jgi:hypothetical protein
MSETIEINRQTAQIAASYLLPTTILLYALVFLFVPLNFPTGIEFAFGNRSAQSQFTDSMFVVAFGLLVLDAVRSRRHKILLTIGGIFLLVAIPYLGYGGPYWNEGVIGIVVATGLFVSAVVAYADP